jgi:hypothetical protein
MCGFFRHSRVVKTIIVVERQAVLLTSSPSPCARANLAHLILSVSVSVLAACLSSPSATATIINVPNDQPDIQAGIDASSNGDTVLVEPGTYFENIDYRGKDIVLTSRFFQRRDPQFIFSTVIDGSAPYHPDTASCVRIVDGQGPTTVLQGFTLTGGQGTVWTDPHGAGIYREGGGVLTEFSSPIIQYNLIVDNVAVNTSSVVSAGGGGIRSGDGDPQILNNVIMSNRGRYGAGVVLNYAAGVLRNNVIAFNSGGEDFGGGGIWKLQGTQAIAENNTIVQNSSVGSGGGVYIWQASMVLRNNLIRLNSGSSSGNSQIGTSGGSAIVSYCNISGGYSGTENFDEPVSFIGPYFYPVAGADTGDPDPSLQDPEGFDAGEARWPAQGNLRNDVGAYGGPGSFPFHWIAATSDVAVDWVPCDVSFQAYTWLPDNSWSWDFGDGQTGSTPTPTNTYTEPGYYDLAITVDTGGGSYTQTITDMVAALADTITASEEIYEPGSQVMVTVNARTHMPLVMMQVPVEYSGPIPMALDSMSVEGCRTDYFEVAQLINLDLNGKRATALLQPSADDSQPYLPPGNGPILKFWFRVTGSATADETNEIVLDGYSVFAAYCVGSLGGYGPATVSGKVTVGGCCRDRVGDVNGLGGDEPTIGDVSVLIDAKFISGTCMGVIDCMTEADLNQSGGVDPTCDDVTIGDISTLIDYLFITGPTLGLANCP